MKNFRKVLALVLALILTVGSMAVGASAAAPNEVLPTIFIPGLFQCETKVYDSNGNVMTDSFGNPLQEPFFLPNTIDIVGDALTNALIPITKLLVDQEDKDQLAANAFADVLGQTLMGKNKSDENGDFIYDVRATQYPVSFAEMNEYDQETIFDHIPLQYYIDNAGAETLYFFSYASMGNMKKTAQELYDFVQHVKARTNSEKVNIVPISQGGSIMNALLAIYREKNREPGEDFHRIVYLVPALDGSLIIGEAYEYGFLDEDVELYLEMFPALLGEDDVVSYLINIIIRIMPNADFNTILDVAVDTLVRDYMRYSTLMWGLCPSDNYIPADTSTGRIGARAMYLLDEGCENIREQADWYYYEAQMKSDENILWARETGAEVFNVAEYDFALFHLVDSYDDVNADGIIQLDSTSMGAYSVNVNTPLPANYVPAVSPQCSDPTHNHISPDNIVDAGAGLLPDTTFYFKGQPHEQTASNDVVIKLISELLIDDSFTSVYSYPDKFPQFNGTRKTKSLMNDIEEMKSYDYSEIKDPAIVYEMKEAIAQAEMMLDNTIINDAETSAASQRFYRARDAVYNYGKEAPEEEPSNDAYFDFMPLLEDLIMLLSQILYKFFGGDGFSDM